MNKLALTLPGASGQAPQSVATPSGIPSQLSRDLGTSGPALFTLGVTWLLYIAATVSILMLMWGGIQWITSSGDPEKLSSAKRKITMAIVGLVISVSAFFIVKLIITILGGDSGTFFNFGATS